MGVAGERPNKRLLLRFARAAHQQPPSFVLGFARMLLRSLARMLLRSLARMLLRSLARPNLRSLQLPSLLTAALSTPPTTTPASKLLSLLADPKPELPPIAFPCDAGDDEDCAEARARHALKSKAHRSLAAAFLSDLPAVSGALSRPNPHLLSALAHACRFDPHLAAAASRTAGVRALLSSPKSPPLETALLLSTLVSDDNRAPAADLAARLLASCGSDSALADAACRLLLASAPPALSENLLTGIRVCLRTKVSRRKKSERCPNTVSNNRRRQLPSLARAERVERAGERQEPPSLSLTCAPIARVRSLRSRALPSLAPVLRSPPAVAGAPPRGRPPRRRPPRAGGGGGGRGGRAPGGGAARRPGASDGRGRAKGAHASEGSARERRERT
jgi:hypothetical protein